MHRFYLPKSELKGKEAVLSGAEWHHCKNVLRSETGERVAVFDGEGTEYLAEIVSTSSKEAHLRLLSKSFSPPSTQAVALAQALPKNKAMDLIIQKATELGVREIIPVLSDRSTVRPDQEQSAEKVERWKEIAIEAAKQCGLNWLPRIHPIRTVAQTVALRGDYHHAFIGSLQPDARPLWTYFAEKGSKNSAVLMIGPEGDFTPAELGAARSAGFSPLSLGPLVLRSETAAIYSLSILRHELQRPL